jgi:GntR family transcriptional repressor for pyruvate dehydrogenase complex
MQEVTAPPATLRVIRRHYLYQQVVEAIRDHIVGNGLCTGDPLPSERELCELLGVSRTSLREGVRALVNLGVVDVKNGEGMFVGQLDFRGLMGSIPHSLLKGRDDLLDLMEIRQTLEVLAATRAATRVTDADVARMEAVLAQMQVRVDAGQLSMGEDKEFHELILRAADSPLLTQFLGAISDLVRLIRADLAHAGGPAAQGMDAHREILAAIRDRDADAAGAAMRRHLELVRDSLRRFLEA